MADATIESILEFGYVPQHGREIVYSGKFLVDGLPMHLWCTYVRVDQYRNSFQLVPVDSTKDGVVVGVASEILRAKNG